MGPDDGNDGKYTAAPPALSSTWVACEACAKWRRVPEDITDTDLEGFVCASNVVWDASRATCAVEEEVVAADEE